jgi:hypothetical protein
MLWRYSETYTTDAKSIAEIKAAQDQRLTGILTLLDEELGKKKGLTQITRFRSYHGYQGQGPSQSLQTGLFDRAFRIGLDVIDGCPSVRSEPKDVELILSSAT